MDCVVAGSCHPIPSKPSHFQSSIWTKLNVLILGGGESACRPAAFGWTQLCWNTLVTMLTSNRSGAGQHREPNLRRTSCSLMDAAHIEEKHCKPLSIKKSMPGPGRHLLHTEGWPECPSDGSELVYGDEEALPRPEPVKGRLVSRRRGHR